MTDTERPRAWADIMSHCVANMGEEAFNDVLTEPYHPLAGVWCALDVDIRAKARQQWRDRLRREFDAILAKANEAFAAQFPDPVDDTIIAEVECPACSAPLCIYEDEDGKQRVLTGPVPHG